VFNLCKLLCYIYYRSGYTGGERFYYMNYRHLPMVEEGLHSVKFIIVEEVGYE
jgi:hypothetical protein